MLFAFLVVENMRGSGLGWAGLTIHAKTLRYLVIPKGGPNGQMSSQLSSIWATVIQTEGTLSHVLVQIDGSTDLLQFCFFRVCNRVLCSHGCYR